MTAPVIFVPHGGGPLPLMNDASHSNLVRALKNLASTIAQPSAVIVVTAHWEGANVLISSAPSPGMLFDYYGFPPETYHYSYPAPGHPALAASCLNLLQSADVDAALDSSRGFDHGTFVPLMLIYPDATIPVVQISLHKSLDPELHIRVGKALASLRQENVMILGSGMSFHNMNAFFNPSATAKNASKNFDDWLVSQLCEPVNELVTDQIQQAREAALIRWAEVPFARFCHPREEHLLPLHVCLGAAAGSTATTFFHDTLLNMQISGFIWD